MEVKKLVVVGGGAMGKQIALNSAIFGVRTVLTDSFPGVIDNAKNWSDEYLQGRIAKGKMTAEEVDQVKERFILCENLEDSLDDADLVIEAIFERMDAKLELFKKLDELTPSKTILASNSSTWIPSLFASVTNRPEKVINIHYFNPALHMKLVEVVLSEAVSKETVEVVMDFAAKTGKTAIKVQKELDGFIVNNILGGITKVAWSLLENGYATAQDIDLGAELGLGHPMGPFKLLDFAGLDTILDIRKARYKQSGDEKEKPPQILVDMVARGETGRKAGKGFYDYNK